ncbi:DUF2982 domain-containing protein [Vibrio intestinalis]|uniref:DUF2982 domain-containing protein n=1 Tax=Vibrio intestinalis TaxID=2933291 RepID=UPI0021A71616|nr:DUF2982 domain-containing protein [Vibrio intestinalis]
MPTLHLINHRLFSHARHYRWALFFIAVCSALTAYFANDIRQLLVGLFLLLVLSFFAYCLILKSTVRYTLTSSHFQQHFSKGGWVVQWSNISKIGVCQYQQQGWYQSLPWIGIKLKDYSPYLDGICPRVATEILLGQRALLYLGTQQKNNVAKFEDVVLDSHPYTDENGKVYTGLQAMLANRMNYQRNYFDYDVFISTSDLDRPADEFVGLTRRYLAANQTR